MLETKNSGRGQPAAASTDYGIGARTLSFLHEQRLEPTPANYSLGYIYLTERKSLAARAVDLILIGGERLDQKRAHQITADHVRAGSADGPDQQSAIRHQTLQLSEIAAGATAITGKFNRDLSSGLTALDEGADITAIVRSMVERSRESEAALASASRQIETLRREVETAKGDAARDALTGLHNRRGVEVEVRALPARADSSLVICDIDHFKSINDRYGHVVGDRVLKLVASSLAKSCHPHLVARWGGEEFIILLNGLSPKDAAMIVDKARLDLSERDVRLRATDKPMGAITFSAGVAALNARPFDDAVSEADALLYQAKAAGRNRVSV
ncbi:GGDEF domain-containing protein [Sphingomonas sp. CD22]|uniref:GGDEF domain-containing protein n=1 Tax=Sphingomonas sp. CD22 TaxID=3100214 RepID=UPI00121798CC|nr:GGDEF domain-containing protein [Sphingomonas sp. CD22]MEA1086438.1 GGDEF domain-containing protein [Sphingomonas sp. CD22]RZL85591.1 MAG: GGDEF domain-containing protein [Sphingomonas sp.]